MAAALASLSIIPPMPAQGLTATQGHGVGAAQSITGAPTGSKPLTCTLETLRWRKRPLIVFARDAADPRLGEEHQEARGAMTARGSSDDLDLVFIAVAAGKAPCGGATLKRLTRSIALRRGNFHVLLMGKDGGVKLSSDRIIPGRTIAAAIEAMPMRRAETAQRGD